MPDPGAGRCGLSCWHGELLADGSSWADGAYRLAVEPRTVTAIGADPFIVAAFRRLAESFRGYGPGRSLVCRDLIRLVWLHLIETWGATAGPAGSTHLEPMLAWIRDHLDRPVGRTQLARAFGLTPNHINALFRQGLGLTPGEVVRRERVLRAWHDLHAGGLSVAETALRWGFGDPGHFSRVFRKVMGFPPSTARANRGSGRQGR